jgi:hypothetical protein
VSEARRGLRTRGELLAELAGYINDLTEVRHHVEIYETEINTGTRRRRTRRRHITTQPSLLVFLTQAMEPGSSEDMAALGGFESRPAAAINPTSVMRTIVDDSARWARTLSMARYATLPGRLHGLVSAAMTDNQLHNLVGDARWWVHMAKIATGEEPEPFTLNQPCPYCWRKHALVIAGDLGHAHCKACAAEWDEVTIGLLGQMLTANETRETLTDEPCWWADCYRLGSHLDHWGRDGRIWQDSCAVWVTSPARVASCG